MCQNFALCSLVYIYYIFNSYILIYIAKDIKTCRQYSKISYTAIEAGFISDCFKVTIYSLQKK